MIIRKYGIELRRLTDSDLELVREQRNSAHVRKGMFFRETITPEMQRTWFDSQNNKSNYHFIICAEGKKTGLISGKNVDFNKGTSEGGIFIWNEQHLGTPVPVIASVIMAELTFNLLGLKKTYAETRTDNPSALRYNYLLGYEKLEEIRPEQKVMLVLTHENFRMKGSRFLDVIRKSAKEETPLSWSDIHFDHLSKEEIDHLYSGLPSHIQSAVNERL